MSFRERGIERLSVDSERRRQATDRSGVAQGVRDLITSGLFEVAPGHAFDAYGFAKLLPAGMSVYVHHSPRHPLAWSLPALKAIRSAGLNPVPHIAVRRVTSRQELDSFLERVVGECGVSKLLFFGGDVPQPLGPYASGARFFGGGRFSCARHTGGRSPRLS